jgi:rRNA-processing protein FCF1
MAINRIRKHKINVILDTSSLLTPFEFSINIDHELEKLLGSFNTLIPSCVLKELRFLSQNSKGKTKRFASAALQLAEKYGVIDCIDDDADDAIVNIAKKIPKAVVVTNDVELKRKLRSNNIPVISLRGKKRFVLEGEIK